MKTEQKIRELVPSLQELTFGCEFKIYSEPVEKLAYIQSFTSGYSRVRTIRDNGDVYTVLRSREEIESLEILGHPIQLHHILQAIPDNKLELRLSKPYLLIYDMYRAESVQWDLTKDYRNQSEKVKEFIGSLLN